MSKIINVDEKLAAKNEIEKDPVQFIFRDQTWNFSPSLPAQMPELFAEGKIVSAVILALDPDQREDFVNLGITMDEMTVFVDALAEAYGTTEEK